MNKLKAKIVICAVAGFGIEIAEFLIKNKIPINYIVSLTPEQAEKYNVSGYSSFEKLSVENTIPIYYANTYSLRDGKDIDFFKKNKFDLLITGGWQRLIPKEVLETLSIGGIGSHGSSEFLPKGRGRSPINWSLIEGRKKFIMNIFKMDPKPDSGDIIDYKVFDINPWDDCGTLYNKYSIVIKRMLLKNIPLLMEGKVTIRPQKGQASYYPKRTPEDGLIDWDKPLYEIYNFIRALVRPYPGAFSFIGNKKILIWCAQPFDTKIKYPKAQYGEIVEVFHNGQFIINCRKGLLLVKEWDVTVAIEIGKVLKGQNK